MSPLNRKNDFSDTASLIHRRPKEVGKTKILHFSGKTWEPDVHVSGAKENPDLLKVSLTLKVPL